MLSVKFKTKTDNLSTGGINMLEIRNFTKSYGEKKAVEGISLSIHSGDIYGFI